MKFNKRRVFAIALAICLIATISFSTLAWFNDSEEITNKFMVATSDDETPDDIFSIDVWENVDEDGDGEPDRIDEDGFEFENVVPGAELLKEPFVENTGRYAQWVRLTIEFGPEWEPMVNGTIQDAPLALLDFADDFASNWKGVSNDFSDGYVYTYYLKEALEPDEVVAIFDQVNIPEYLDQEDLFGIKELTLNVKAEAIQLELGDTVEEAFAAYEAPVNP